MNQSAAYVVYEFAGFRLDPRRRVLYDANGQPLALKPKVFDTLLHLVEHPDVMLDKRALMKAVWGDVIVEENSLNQHVSALRRVLGEGPGENRYIVTVPGRGYRFVAPVIGSASAVPAPEIRVTKAGQAPAAVPVAPPSRATDPPSARRRVPWAVVMLAATVLFAGIGLLLLRAEPELQPAASVVPTERAVAPPGSIAVLPFANLSPDPHDAYFAAGIHEEILTQLAKIKSLTVISRTSMLRYANSSLSVPELAKELNVAAVIEGSVRFAGDRIRVSVQLVDAAADRRLWAETYDHGLENIFATQSDIATNVVAALQAEFSSTERARVATVATRSLDAYALYLQSTELTGAAGIELLERAIAIDPDFALARALIARRYAFTLTNNNIADSVSADQRAAIEAKVAAYARRAIEIDPNVPYAYTALAVPLHTNWRWTEAEAVYKRAIELAPNDLIARNAYGYLLSSLGRHEEATAVGKRAVELNPGNPNAGWYGFWVGASGDYARAADVIRDATALDGTDLLKRDWLAFMEIARGNAASALEQLELSERLAGDNRLVALLPEWAYSYGRLGRTADAERIFREIAVRADEGHSPGAGGWAMAYLSIGDQQRALESLEIAAGKAARHERDEGFYNVMNLKMNVTNDAVLREPEFARVLARIAGD